MLPIGNRVRRLADIRSLKRKFKIRPHFRTVDDCRRMVDAVFVTKLIELFLIDQNLDQLRVYGRYDAVVREAVPVQSCKFYISVTAADHQDLGVLMGVREFCHTGDKRLGLLVVRIGMIVDDAAPVSGTGLVFAVAGGPDPVLLVESTGNGIYINIAAE